MEQPHVRFWATALCAPTTAGRVWLKASAPALTNEARISALLHAAAPELVLAPLATDEARGWVLLPDGGRTLRGDDAVIPVLAAVMEAYAALQRVVASEVEVLLDRAVPDMRPIALPGRLDEALAAAAARVGPGEDEDRRTLARVAALGDRVTAWCERLAAAPGSPSIDHNDLHPGNVLVRDGRATLYDWGDSVVAHPFASLLVPLGHVAREYGAGSADDARVLAVRDAYLRGFADLAPHAELVQTAQLACHVAKIARALTWERALRCAVPGDTDPKWQRGPLHCLAALLDESYLGGL